MSVLKKPIDYPYTDDLGYHWLDSNTILATYIGNCFFCNEPTNRIDVNYGDLYCGNDDEAIEADLKSYEDLLYSVGIYED